MQICKRKVNYVSMESALDGLQKLRRRLPYESPTLGAYPCSKCDMWHIGHWSLRFKEQIAIDKGTILMKKRISNSGISVIARAYAIIRRDLDGGSTVSPKELFDTMVSDLADMLGDDNERFDRDRFFTVIYKDKV